MVLIILFKFLDEFHSKYVIYLFFLWCLVIVMHPRHPGMHIAIDSKFWAWIYLSADMFPYEDFNIVSLSVYATARKKYIFILNWNILA